jgi:hypothetical protein
MPSVLAFMMNVLSTQPLRFNTTSPTPTPMLRSVLDFQEDTTVSVPQSVCGDDPSAIGATDGNDAAPIPRSLSSSRSRDDVGGEGDGVATAMYRNAWSRSKLSEARRMGLRFFLSRRYSCEASRHTSTRQSQQASSPSV